MIELTDITKDFGRTRALAGVCLHVGQGTIHGIVGENGAGKSTLMKVLTGYIGKTSGSIHLDGRPVSLNSPRDARALAIGMLYQEPMDFPRLTVLENFLAGSASHASARQRQGFADLCTRFGFALNPDLPVNSLTIGERQQLELLRLIRDEVRILILDEPTTGISAEQELLLFDALRTLREAGAAILLVSHKLDEVESLCDQVSVLRHGRVAAEQTKPFDRVALLAAMFDTLPEAPPAPQAAAQGPPVLEMTDLVSTAGRTGLAIDHLTIFGGEVVGLAGLDGSGQSVLLRIARGLVQPERGSIKRFGRPGTGQDVAAVPNTAYLPADRLAEGLIGGLSLREHHVLATPSSRLIHGDTGRDRTERAIATFQIRGEADTPVENLSGGNQQRFLLSLIEPGVRLLLLENPTRGLDVHSAAWTWQHLQDMVPPDGALLFASPDLEEIMAQANRILVFFEGRILLDAATASLTHDRLSRAITGEVVEAGQACT